MRISGRRKDGALHLSIGAGMAVILRGGKVSKPLDESDVMGMGPWSDVPFCSEDRKQVFARLEIANVVPVSALNCAMSFDEQRDRVTNALRARFGMPSNNYGAYPTPMGDLYVPQNGLGEDWVVYCWGGKYYSMDYSITDDGRVQFDNEPNEVRQGWESVTEDEVNASDDYKALRGAPWFKKFMDAKKKKAEAK